MWEKYAILGHIFFGQIIFKEVYLVKIAPCNLLSGQDFLGSGVLVLFKATAKKHLDE